MSSQIYFYRKKMTNIIDEVPFLVNHNEFYLRNATTYTYKYSATVYVGIH